MRVGVPDIRRELRDRAAAELGTVSADLADKALLGEVLGLILMRSVREASVDWPFDTLLGQVTTAVSGTLGIDARRRPVTYPAG